MGKKLFNKFFINLILKNINIIIKLVLLV